jgi:hypothetical protein
MVSNSHSNTQSDSGVMEDNVPTGNLAIIILAVVIIVGGLSLGLRKGFEQLLQDTIFTQQLANPDSRLVATQKKSSALLAGESVGDLKPRMAIGDAMKSLSANPSLLGPMRPASALGVEPTPEVGGTAK